jgi:alpha-glucoside transport system permease protein
MSAVTSVGGRRARLAARAEPGVVGARRPRRGSRLALNIVLGGIALFWLLPTISLTIISLRPESLFGISGWWKAFTAPSELTLHNYSALFSQGLAAGGLLDSLVTSLVITIPATLLVTVLSSLAAYSLVFGSWRGRDAVFLTVVGLIVVPLQVAMIPVVELYRSIGNVIGFNAYGTIIGVIIFHVGFGLPFGIFLMRNFYTGIPRDLIEAGRIDGAREWTLFRRVVLPLGLPAAAALAVFQFIWVWNDLVVALVFLGGNVHQTLTLFLYGQTRTLAENYWVISAGGIVSIIVPMVVFFAFQKHFVRGMLAGAVK